MAYDKPRFKREMRKIGRSAVDLAWKHLKSFPGKSLEGMLTSTFRTVFQLFGLSIKACLALVRLALKT